MSEYTGKIAVKAKNGKGFKIEGNDNWFNATDKVAPYLAKINKGESVVVTYDKKGVQQTVNKIVKASGDSESKVTIGTETKTTWIPKSQQSTYSKYDNPEKTAQIQRGNALNAASYLLSGRHVAKSGTLIQEDPETLAEMCIVVAQQLLDWLRAE